MTFARVMFEFYVGREMVAEWERDFDHADPHRVAESAWEEAEGCDSPVTRIAVRDLSFHAQPLVFEDKVAATAAGGERFVVRRCQGAFTVWEVTEGFNPNRVDDGSLRTEKAAVAFAKAQQAELDG